MNSVTGTYYGVLPSDVETTLTLNADGAYLLIRTFKEKQNEQERLKGTFQILDGNIPGELGNTVFLLLFSSGLIQEIGNLSLP